MIARFFAPVLATIALALFAFPQGVYSGEPEKDVYPKPQSVKRTGTSFLDATKLSAAAVSKSPVLKKLFKDAKLRAAGTVSISIERDKSRVGQIFSRAKIKSVPGAYYLKVSSSQIEIAAADDAGAFYAQQTLARMIEADGKIALCEIADWPDVPFRGSVEGFYGRVWSHEARLSQFRFYGKYKMNAYVYGPKDDPYHKNRWRDVYPPAEAKKIKELVDVATENCVHFTWAIHLGASFNQNDKENEYRRMEAKFEDMYKLGVRSFAIFFDDFGGADGNFHAEACNRAVSWLNKKGDCEPLVLCPNQYNRAWASGNYLEILGQKLDKSVNVMWTGNSVCSDITEEGIRWINDRLRRKAYIWWNWPVVDYCSTALLLGRTYGLAKENKDRYSGFASNPMDKPEASKIALFGVGDYCWNVDAFDSETSWKAGIRQLFPKYHEAMQTLANHSSDQGKNAHGYRREESEEFRPVVEKATEEMKGGKLNPSTAKKLIAEFEKMQTAGKTLVERVPEDNPELWLEIEFWARALGETGKFGEAAVNFATKKPAEPAERMKLACAAAKYHESRFRTMEKQREHARQIGAPHQNPSKVAERVVMPFLEALFKDTWARTAEALGGKRATAKTGSSASAGTPLYRAFSDVPVLKNIQAAREGKVVRIEKINEQVRLGAGQHIGLSLPEGIYGSYLHITLDSAAAAKAGTVEVSTDGEKWARQTVKISGGNVEANLDAGKKIRAFRFVNKTGKTLDFRINQFKFDVPEGASANSKDAAFDGDPTTGYTVPAGTTATFAGEGPAKTAYVLTDAPAKNVSVSTDGKKAKVSVRAGKNTPVTVFEIIWK